MKWSFLFPLNVLLSKSNQNKGYLMQPGNVTITYIYSLWEFPVIPNCRLAMLWKDRAKCLHTWFCNAISIYSEVRVCCAVQSIDQGTSNILSLWDVFLSSNWLKLKLYICFSIGRSNWRDPLLKEENIIRSRHILFYFYERRFWIIGFCNIQGQIEIN